MEMNENDLPDKWMHAKKHVIGSQVRGQNQSGRTAQKKRGMEKMANKQQKYIHPASFAHFEWVWVSVNRQKKNVAALSGRIKWIHDL